MKFAVSHIAWSPEEEAEGWALARSMGIGHGEIAPGRRWRRGYIERLAAEGFPAGGTAADGIAGESAAPTQLPVAGFQAILYGFPELTLFAEGGNAPLLRYLGALAKLCALAGGRYLVFGAPKNRVVPGGMPPTKAMDIAVRFFTELAGAAEREGVVFGFEANPAFYGGNFGTRAEEAVALVREVARPGFRWHLDTGEIAMNGLDPRRTVELGIDVLGSAHVSQPGIGDFSEPWPGHPEVARALRESGYGGFVSLEMKRPANGLRGVREAMEFLLGCYG